MRLTPVEGNPFDTAKPQPKLTPVEGNPFAPTPPSATQPDSGPGPKDYLDESISQLKTGLGQLGEMAKESVTGAPQLFREGRAGVRGPGGVVAGVGNAIFGAPLVQGAMEAAPGLIGPESAPERLPEAKAVETPKPLEATPVSKTAALKAPETGPKLTPVEGNPFKEAAPVSKTAPKLTPVEGNPFEAKPQALSAEAAPEATVPGKGKVTHQAVVDEEARLYQQQALEQNRRTEIGKHFAGLPEEVRSPELRARAYAKMEGDPTAQLSSEESALVQQHFEPMRKSNAELRAEMMAEGKNAGFTEDDLEALANRDTMHRMVRGKTGPLDKELNIAAGEEVDPATGGNYSRAGAYKAGSTKNRSYFALEDAEGNRSVAHVSGDNLYKVEPGGQEVLIPRSARGGEKVKVGNYLTHDNVQYQIKDAYSREVEEATKGGADIRYIKDAYASLAEDSLELNRMADQAANLKNTKARFVQNGWATTRSDAARKLGWQEVKVRGMQGYYVEPRIAAALEKFEPRRAEESPTEWLHRLNSFANESLFWNPIPHMRNVLTNAAIDRGFRNWDFGARYAPYLKKAWQDASEQSEFAQKAYAEGAALRYPSIANRDLFKKILAGVEEAQEDKSFLGVAKRLGMKPIELKRAIYAWSHDALWKVNDVALLARLREKMATEKNMTLERAVKELHDVNADYRVPSEAVVPGKTGRNISRLMTNNLITQFARYHYSNAKALLTMPVRVVQGLRSVGKQGLEAQHARRQAVNAVGKAISTAIAYEVVNNVGAEIAQGITGDPRARLPAFGLMAYIRLLDDMLNGRLTDEASWAKALTMMIASASPMIQIGLAVVSLDYAGRPIKPKKGESQISADLKQAAPHLYAPLGQVEKAVKGGLGTAVLDATLGSGKTPMTEEEYKRSKK